MTEAAKHVGRQQVVHDSVRLALDFFMQQPSLQPRYTFECLREALPLNKLPAR